ncbi:MAG: S-layer homology domain-containing protein [Defluviitaleaceae bacterium]|nr:S-layer homology domain-containing protein [Defluviitaleaceae bacterium]
MKKTWKKLLALTLAMLLLLALIPASALAASDVTVYVTVSIDGQFGADKSGGDMAYRPVTAPDGASALDVIVAAHKQYYSGGAGGFVYQQAADGLHVYNVWGSSGSIYFSAICNDQMISSFDDLNIIKLNQGGTVDLLISADDAAYTAKFTPPVQSVKPGDAVSVTYSLWGSTSDGAASRWLPYPGAGLIVDGAQTDFTSDSNGLFTFNLLTSGAHVITAASGYTTNAACAVVNVTPLFSDMPGHWAEQYVNVCSLTSLVNGTGGGQFTPDASMTREQLVTIIWRMCGSPAPASAAAFSDVAAGSYYADAVAWGNENGIVTGYSGTVFGVGNPVTREQVAVIFYRLATMLKERLSGINLNFSTGVLDNFKDASSISGYARDAMAFAYTYTVIHGYPDGTLNPQGNATRAEISTMVTRFLDSAYMDLNSPPDNRSDILSWYKLVLGEIQGD